MLPFSFVEMFFFLSLGITFILILLIVYHFKQRITTMEHKCDTMFDIVQNLAKEVSDIKIKAHTTVMDMGGGGMFMPHQHIFMQQHHPSMGDGFHMSENPSDNLEPVVQELTEAVDTYDYGDDSSGETDCDSDSDNDDDSDSGSDSSDDILYTGEEVVIEHEEYKCMMDSKGQCQEESFEKIKVAEDEILATTIPELDIMEDSQAIDHPVEEGPRMERQLTLIEDTPDESNAGLEPHLNDSVENKDTISTTEDYKKLSLNELKKLVVSKGIQKDASKLKRQDLLKLLQDAIVA